MSKLNELYLAHNGWLCLIRINCPLHRDFFLLLFSHSDSPPYELMSLARPLKHGLRRRAVLGASEVRRGIVTQAEVDQAKGYCVNQLK